MLKFLKVELKYELNLLSFSYISLSGFFAESVPNKHIILSNNKLIWKSLRLFLFILNIKYLNFSSFIFNLIFLNLNFMGTVQHLNCKLGENQFPNYVNSCIQPGKKKCH